MAPVNPYAPPQTLVLTPAGTISNEGAWQTGSLLVMRKTASLPDRCVKCNRPANGHRLKRKLSWHHPAWFLLFLVSPLIYVIVALCIRQTAKIHVGLCDRHRARRRNAIIIGWLIVLAGIALPFIGVAITPDNAGFFFLGGFVLFFVGAIGGLLGARTLTPTKIDDYFVWLKGADPEFLAQLPTA